MTEEKQKKKTGKPRTIGVDWDNPDEVRAYRNRKAKEYAARDKGNPNSSNAKWRESHKENLQRNFAKYYEANKEKHRAYMREYYRKNKDKYRDYSKKAKDEDFDPVFDFDGVDKQ